jgi:hypothetical protein
MSARAFGIAVALTLGACAGCASGDRTLLRATEPPPPSENEVEFISIVLLRKAACDRAVPGFSDRSAEAYARWRRHGTAAIVTVERGAAFRSRLAGVDKLPRGPVRPDEREQAEATCGDEFIRYLYELGRDADPRLATPESTWKTFVAALRAHDREAASALLTRAARHDQRRLFADLSDERLEATGNAFVRFELKEVTGPYHVGAATRRNGSRHTVYFERSWNGDWLIAAL